MDIIRCCKAILKSEYGIDEAVIESQQGGWAALAFKVRSVTSKYFLKVYEKSRSSTEKWTKTIDFYIPIIKWLIENAEMNGKIVSPVYTIDGEYMCEDKENVYLLFDYIEGVTVGDKALIDTQVKELAAIVGRLHSIVDQVPLPKDSFYEDYELPFCKELLKFIEQDITDARSDIKNILYPYLEDTKDFILKICKLAENLKREDLKNVLCHTDIHHWNMMQGENLILIDWEGLKLAPPEHDLFSIITQPYGNAFLKEYFTFMPNYKPNPKVFEFYFLRRKLEDVWEWVELLHYNKPRGEAREEALAGLLREFKAYSFLGHLPQNIDDVLR